MILEICVDSLDAAIEAEKNGADRIELCSDLTVGGLSPGEPLLAECLRSVKIPVMVMVRPRPGNFIYSDYDFEQMRWEVEMTNDTSAAGIVFGAMNVHHAVDLRRCAELCSIVSKKEVTFHRAFDRLIDPAMAIDQLADIGVTRILTSGGEVSALAGKEKLQEYVQLAEDRIIIMPGGNVRPENIQELASFTGATELHSSAYRSAAEMKKLMKS